MKALGKKWEGDRRKRFFDNYSSGFLSSGLGLAVEMFLYLGLQVLSGSPPL